MSNDAPATGTSLRGIGAVGRGQDDGRRRRDRPDAGRRPVAVVHEPAGARRRSGRRGLPLRVAGPFRVDDCRRSVSRMGRVRRQPVRHGRCSTPSARLAAGRDVVFVIDVQGARQLRKREPGAGVGVPDAPVGRRTRTPPARTATRTPTTTSRGGCGRRATKSRRTRSTTTSSSTTTWTAAWTNCSGIFLAERARLASRARRRSRRLSPRSHRSAAHRTTAKGGMRWRSSHSASAAASAPTRRWRWRAGCRNAATTSSR